MLDSESPRTSFTKLFLSQEELYRPNREMRECIAGSRLFYGGLRVEFIYALAVERRMPVEV